jgi:hypothetical protein
MGFMGNVIAIGLLEVQSAGKEISSHLRSEVILERVGVDQYGIIFLSRLLVAITTNGQNKF